MRGKYLAITLGAVALVVVLWLGIELVNRWRAERERAAKERALRVMIFDAPIFIYSPEASKEEEERPPPLAMHPTGRDTLKVDGTGKIWIKDGEVWVEAIKTQSDGLKVNARQPTSVDAWLEERIRAEQREREKGDRRDPLWLDAMMNKMKKEKERA